MEKKVNSFVALDFEFMTPNHATACAVGMVKVINDIVVQKFYSLIKPIPYSEDEKLNTPIHGITPEMCKDAPTFGELHGYMAGIIGTLPIVAHNKGTETAVLRKACSYYGLEDSPICNPDIIDTLEYCGKKLDVACAEYGIPLPAHHDPLDDATACAELYMKVRGMEIVKPEAKEKRQQVVYSKGRSENEKELCTPLPDEKVINKNTAFFHKHVVVTGNFPNSYPDRNTLKSVIKALGGINTRSSKGVTHETEIVIIGEKAGPNKIKAIEEHKEHLTVWNEEQLMEIMRQINESQTGSFAE